MTIEIIDAVSNFCRDLNEISPNVRDTAKRRVGQKQWETARVIFFHESYDKIWVAFQINQQEIAAKLANKKSFKVHPMIFQKA